MIGGEWLLEKEREVIINGNYIAVLSRIQFKILYILAVNKNEPVSCSDIIEFAWGNKNYSSKNTLYVYIYHLRKLIEEDYKNPRYLLNVRNYGYLLYKV